MNEEELRFFQKIIELTTTQMDFMNKALENSNKILIKYNEKIKELLKAIRELRNEIKK